MNSETDLSLELRALRVDPPDDGFAARLGERLEQVSPQAPLAPVLPLRPRRGNRRFGILAAAASVFLAGAAAAALGGGQWAVEALRQGTLTPTMAAAKAPPPPPPKRVRTPRAPKSARVPVVSQPGPQPKLSVPQLSLRGRQGARLPDSPRQAGSALAIDPPATGALGPRLPPGYAAPSTLPRLRPDTIQPKLGRRSRSSAVSPGTDPLQRLTPIRRLQAAPRLPGMQLPGGDARPPSGAGSAGLRKAPGSVDIRRLRLPDTQPGATRPGAPGPRQRGGSAARRGRSAVPGVPSHAKSTPKVRSTTPRQRSRKLRQAHRRRMQRRQRQRK